MTTSNNRRTVIISDTHMGQSLKPKACTPEKLRPLWQGASHLIINGDIAELQQPEMRAQAAKDIQRLINLCEEDGVELTLLSGNHDAYINDTRHLLLAEDQVLLTHGDVLHIALVPWMSGALSLRDNMEKLISRLPSEQLHDINARLEASQHVSHDQFVRGGHKTETNGMMRLLTLPWRLCRVIYYWLTIPSLAARFAKRYTPQARVIVFGHSHRQGVWRRGERVVINTGSFTFPGKPWMVVLEEHRLSVWPIKSDAGGYTRGSNPITEFELDPSQPIRRIA